MGIDLRLIESAIKIAKENKETFSFNLLKIKLRVGLCTCNMLLDELEDRGIIKQHNKNGEGKYKIEVLI
ncbi:hypothetical protein ACR77J_16700 [Tissierella praeacuta]|uniref:hypothetical protein n=1 Tax=Tissierella praeacuta TaxID=43131 RepID=UPI003DA654C4